MERLWKIVALIVFSASASMLTGCSTLQTFHETRHSMMQAVGVEPPPPASEFVCCWQNRLHQLNDPTKQGAQIPGLPGQMFLFTPDYKAAKPTGELTVAVYDDTPRPNGAPGHSTEIWHFTKDKLEQMVAVDERFGQNIVLFIPWPENWRDVSRVKIKASYQQPGTQHKLYSPESVVVLDFIGVNQGSGIWKPAGPDLKAALSQGIPDANAIISQIKSGSPGVVQNQFPNQQPIMQVQGQMSNGQNSSSQQYQLNQANQPNRQSSYPMPPPQYLPQMQPVQTQPVQTQPAQTQQLTQPIQPIQPIQKTTEKVTEPNILIPVMPPSQVR